MSPPSPAPTINTVGFSAVVMSVCPWVFRRDVNEGERGKGCKLGNEAEKEVRVRQDLAT